MATLNAFAAGLFGAAAMVSVAAAGTIAPSNSHDDQTGSIATAVSTLAPPYRVYCYSGVTGSPNALSRGWVCQRVSGSEKR